MIPLTVAAERLRLTTTSIANIDVIASFADVEDAAHPIIGKQMTTLAAATTTDILFGPAAGKQRTLKTLTARNRHATTANTVTLSLFDGTSSTFQITTVALGAGEVLHYHEGAGFYVHDNQGRLKNNDSANGANAAVNALNLVVLAADVVNNNATLNTMQDVTGLSFAVTAGETYWFLFSIAYQAAATTTGSRWAINGPASPTKLSYAVDNTLTIATSTLGTQSGYDVPAASNASSAVASALGGNMARIEGFIEPSASGTVTARFASEIASSAITAKKGSLLQWVRTL